MKESFGRLEFECGIECEVKESVKKNQAGAEIHTFLINWDYEKVEKDTEITIQLKEDAVGHMYKWHPLCGFDRSVTRGWFPAQESMTSISAPISSIFDGNGRNTFTCAVSEVKEVVDLKTAIVGNNRFAMVLKIKLAQYIKCGHLELKLLIDETDIPMYKAIDNVRIWWEEECGLKPMPVPSDAKDAMYSYWYSFQQELFQEPVLEEAERVKELGLKTVILDDGWQMEGHGVRYAYTGDWQVSEKKFSDFAGTIDKLHDMGLKVILWIALPYLGEKSELWDRFKDKVIQHSAPAWASILDPRYPEVREYLIDTLKRIMNDYNPDGFKLDFIDLFYDVEDSKISDEMDYLSVQDAVNRLMTDVKSELLKVNPDSLIEFRQKYIGPCMRTFGNMFRVEDCPDNYMINKIGVLDLRLLSGDTAVHSDMLMWNENESVEIAALQIINIIFGTMQFSGKLSELSDEHKRMVKFWIRFMDEYKDLLLNAPIIVEEPQLLYTAARTEKNGESAIAVYSNDKCITLNPDMHKNVIINGTERERIVIEATEAVRFNMRVLNCFGEVVKTESISLDSGIKSLNVPVSGIIILEK